MIQSNAGETVSQVAINTAGLTITVRPDADLIDGAWTNEFGNTTNLFASVDASAPSDDTDYIVSSINPIGDIVRLSLPDPGPGVAQPFTVRYRFRCTGAVTLTVRLLQGSTTIATWVETPSTDGWLVGAHSLTGPEFAAITDFTDLNIESQADS